MNQKEFDELIGTMQAVGLRTYVMDEQGEILMVAGYDTIDHIYDLLRKYVPKEQMDRLVMELTTIPGNKSFRETIERLRDLHASKKERK